MQFRQADLPAIISGAITLSFRRWKRPQARAGKRHRLGDGAIEIVAVEAIAESEITLSDARASGCDTPADVLTAVHSNLRSNQDPNAQLYRIEFRWLGEQPHPRDALADDDALDAAAQEEIVERLARMDRRSRRGAWTARTLSAIRDAPGRRAGDLAQAQSCETAAFKADVRKLKALGLTTSLEIGYRLSPRGQVVLAEIERRQPARPAT